MIEHTFAPVEVADGIVRVTYPMPMKPGHVHGYLVATAGGYLLVDAGLGLPEMAEHWAALVPQLDRPITEILITHFHPDHVGGTADAVEATGASVLQGALDHYQCEKVWGSDAWVPQLAAWFARQGVPPEETAELLEVGSVYRRFVHFVPDARLLREGDEVAGWNVVEFPGHADGHICLLKDDVLIAGDHLLPRITPAVGLYPDSRPDPLGDFMASLERVARLAPQARSARARRPDRRPGRSCPGDRPASPRAARRDGGGAPWRAERRVRALTRPVPRRAWPRPAALRGRRDALSPGTARARGPGRARR